MVGGVKYFFGGCPKKTMFFKGGGVIFFLADTFYSARGLVTVWQSYSLCVTLCAFSRPTGKTQLVLTYNTAL